MSRLSLSQYEDVISPDSLSEDEIRVVLALIFDHLELEIVRESDKTDFLVLLKQGNDSVVLRTALDTPELRRFLPVLSGNEGNVNLMHQIMNEVNSQDPDDWLPLFLDRAV